MDPIASTTGDRARVSGIASGLDTAALVDSLMQIERQPLLRMQANRAGVAEQQGLMRQFNTLLLELRDAARSIDNRNFSGSDASTTEELLAYTTESSSEEVVTATASNGATPGDIDVTVRQLATVGRQFSGIYSSVEAESVLAAGQSVTIDFPNADATDPEAPTAFTVTATGTMSLDDLKDAINRAGDNGGSLHAEVVREGTGDQLRLVLSAGETGTLNDFSVSGGLVMDATREQLAQDSIISLFGGSVVTRSSNFVDDALSGLSFELHGVSDPVDPTDPNPNGPPDPNIPNSGLGRVPSTISVDVDVDTVAERLDGFVKAYNAVMGFIEKQVKVDEASKRAGPLGNDSTLRRVQAQLLRLVSNPYSFSADPGNPFTGGGFGGSPSEIGLSVNGKGQLELDKAVLGDALKSNAEAVREFLSGRDAASGTGFDEGFGTALVSYLEPVVRFGDGLLATRESGYVTRLKSMDDSIARFESRLASRQETLNARFTQMELVVSNLQSQAGFVSRLR